MTGFTICSLGGEAGVSSIGDIGVSTGEAGVSSSEAFGDAGVSTLVSLLGIVGDSGESSLLASGEAGVSRSSFTGPGDRGLSETGPRTPLFHSWTKFLLLFGDSVRGGWGENDRRFSG